MGMPQSFETKQIRVDAMQFTSGEDSADDIITWLDGFGIEARFQEYLPAWENEDRSAGHGEILEHVQIYVPSQNVLDVLVGRWVVRDLLGSISILTDETMTALYTPV